MRSTIGLTLPVAVLVPLVAASPAGALGVPATFPRTIAITDTKQHLVVSGFQMSVRLGDKVHLRVRVAVASTDRRRVLVIAAVTAPAAR